MTLFLNSWMVADILNQNVYMVFDLLMLKSQVSAIFVVTEQVCCYTCIVF